jgi:hypothetical protein
MGDMLNMFKSQFKRLVREEKEALSYSNEQEKIQARIWDWNVKSLIGAWASLANGTQNKNDWNHFAKHVLSEVIEMDKIIKEVENAKK